MMVDADIAGPEGRLVTLAFVTGIGGQDGSYLAERLLADGVEVHALAHEAEPLPDAPGRGAAHRRPRRDVDEVRAAAARPRARRGLQPGRDQLGRAVVGRARAHRPGQRPRRRRADGVGPQAQEQHGRPVRFVQASSAEIFGEPPTSPQDESTADPAGQPVRRREGLRPPHGRRPPPPRPARRQRDPLQPRVARAAPSGS